MGIMSIYYAAQAKKRRARKRRGQAVAQTAYETLSKAVRTQDKPKAEELNEEAPKPSEEDNENES